MTKKQRAQVVELLRCVWGTPYTVRECAVALGISEDVWRVADDISWDVLMEILKTTKRTAGDSTYDTACLEAAARIEQGELP